MVASAEPMPDATPERAQTGREMLQPPSDPSLLQLRCFLAIVETASFAEAGRRLGLSASVVSKTMARLEAAYGVKLLHRSTHAVSPTDEGLALIEPARAAARALAEVAQVLDHSGERSGGTVRLTAPVAFMRHCLVPSLPALRRQHPDIRFDLRASNELLDLAEHGVDLAIRTGPLDGVPGHVQVLWFACPWVVCAAPRYLRDRALPETPTDFASHDLIGFRASEDGLVRAWTFRDPETAMRVRTVPDPIAVFDDGETGWRAALDGLGIARAPLFLAAEALREGRVVELLRPRRDDDMPVSILRRDTRLTPARVESVIAFLRRQPPSLRID